MGCRTEREILKGVYKTPKWIARVNGMSDNQVIAILTRLRSQNVID